MLSFKLVVTVLNGHLISVHIWLKTKGMTTYEWILKRRQKSTKVHNEDEEVIEENNENVPDSQGALSNRNKQRNSLNIYRSKKSKIVHKREA